ncbi:MAG: hypothetical protein AMJ84_04625 [Acidithiobacillales bacterium SM23_46]|nr:MAG: hypothetical protein AMJ84_04625 [Acidithiobacillales bacterium SM23_46]
MTALNYDDLRTEFRLGDDYDPWGHCMHWLFTIADHLYWTEGETPEAWQFRPSPIGPQNDPDDSDRVPQRAQPLRRADARGWHGLLTEE